MEPDFLQDPGTDGTYKTIHGPLLDLTIVGCFDFPSSLSYTENFRSI